MRNGRAKETKPDTTGPAGFFTLNNLLTFVLLKRGHHPRQAFGTNSSSLTHEALKATICKALRHHERPSGAVHPSTLNLKP